MDNGLHTYLRLLEYGKKYWLVFTIGALAMLIFAITDTGFAFLIKVLTDSFAGNVESFESADLKWLLPVGVIIIFLVRGVSGFFSTYNMSWISRHVIRRIRSDVYKKFLYLPTSFLDQKSNADLLSKVIFNIEQVSESTANVLTVLIRDTLTILALTIYMVYLSPMLSAVIFTAAPVIAFIVKILSTLFRRYSERIQDSMGDVTHSIKEILQNHRIIKIFNGQENEEVRFDEINEVNRRHHMKLLRTKAIGDALTIFVASLGVAGVVYVATLDEVKGSMTVGDFSGFITAMVLLMTPLKRLTNVNAMIQRGIAAAASIFSLLDERNEIDRGTKDAQRLIGAVHFKDVNFSYGSEKETLKNINTNIKAGQTIAIVGKSGSGKTTFVNLIPRFYDVEKGSIEIDGLPIEEYTLESLRSNISLVTQEVTLFNDTIENNIMYGGHSNQEITDAVKASHIDEFIHDLPDGLQTKVGDQGILLSGGQRQRIAIARALLKDAPILILDEATSALDSESEKLIQKAFDRLMENRTTFVIAHRLSTIEKADRILVLSDGKIVEEGTHQDLLSQDGEYSLLYKMQFND
tara:strand:- start:904 stop:2637 length:1734 start_codon:yes stop_codon:yes gene_type:complete